MARKLAEPHAAQSKARNGHGQNDPSVFCLSKVLGAGGDGRDVHGARSRTNAHKRKHHERKRPILPLLPPTHVRIVLQVQLPVDESRQSISQSKQHTPEAHERLNAVSIADVAEHGDGQVQRQRGADGDAIDLELGVAQAGLEFRRVEGEDDDGAGAEGGDGGEDAGDDADGLLGTDAGAEVGGGGRVGVVEGG